MRYQLELFFTAVMFFTRLPIPKWVPFSKAHQNEASKYLSLVGWLVGGIGAAIFLAANLIFPTNIAIILSMITTILVTGAFHEDGFADVCDGFGGGWDKGRILTIMKDSRVGAFGVVGIGLLLLLKFVALTEVETSLLPIVIFVAHPLSRFAATSIMLTHDYARETEDSKAKPLSQRMGVGAGSLSAVFALLPLFLLPLNTLWLIIPVLLIRTLMAAYFQKRIGGYTGDCLGAVQQMAEVVVYLSILAIG